MSSVPTKQLYGDVSIGRNASLGGDAQVRGGLEVGHNLTVDGWLDAKNVKGPSKGLFATLENLEAAYPVPEAGWWALVGDTLPAAIYEVKDGKWTATGNTGGNPTISSDELDKIRTEANSALSTAEANSAAITTLQSDFETRQAAQDVKITANADDITTLKATATTHTDEIADLYADAIRHDGDFVLTASSTTIPDTATRVYVGSTIAPTTTTEVTIPKGVELAFGRSGKIGANVKLNLNGTKIVARADQQIFDPSCEIVGPFNCPYIPVEWWGAKGDGVTDDSEAINAAIKYAGRTTVLLAAERYYVANSVRIVETESNKAYYDASTDQNYMTDGMYGQTVLVRGSLWGGENASPVLYIDESCLTLQVQGAIVCHKNADRAVWANTERNTDIQINRIGRARDYSLGVQSEDDITTYGFGEGTAFYHCGGNGSRIKVNTIYGFKYGYKASTEEVETAYVSWMCDDIELGNVVCSYPIYVHLVANGSNPNRCYSFFNSNHITLQASTIGWKQKVQAKIAADDYDTAIVTMIDETEWPSSKISDCTVEALTMDTACYKVCHIQRTSGLRLQLHGAYNDIMGLNGVAGDSMRACIANEAPYSDARKIVEFINCDTTEYVINGTPTLPEVMLVKGCTGFKTNLVQDYHNTNSYFMLVTDKLWYSCSIEPATILDDLGADTTKNSMAANGQALLVDADSLDRWNTTVITDESQAKSDGVYQLKKDGSKVYALLDVESGVKHWIGYVIPKSTKGDKGDTGAKGEQGNKGDAAVIYRLIAGTNTFKSNTTSIPLNLVKTEGSNQISLATLPDGWRIKVECSTASGSVSIKTQSTLESINPIGYEVVDAVLYNGDPDMSGTQIIDQVSAFLVSDGPTGPQGEKGKQGEKGENATLYRLIAASVYKADTTALAIGVQKVEGTAVENLTTLPTGWKIGVDYSSGASTKSEVLSALGSIDPHAWSEVVISLCDGDPSLSATNVLDQATLRLVSDGAKGDKGDDGALTNYPIVECAGEIVLSDCYPNRIYKADSAITTLSVDVIYYSDGTNGTDFSAHGGIADEYVFDFIAGASCSVSLPEAVVWAATPSFSEGKRYIISIVDNLGLCAEYTI